MGIQAIGLELPQRLQIHGKYSAGTAGGLNEWIWKDASEDNRTDNFGGFVDGSKQDILEVRIASDANNLYYLVKFPPNIDKTPGDGSLQIQISIRRPGSTANEEWLGGFADTKVPNGTQPSGVPDARWDYLIITRAGSGNNNHIVWTTNFGSYSYVGNFQWNTTAGVYEGSVPWSSLGGSPGTGTFVMTISLYRANNSDNTFDTGGDNSKGNCLDYVTTTSGNTYGALIGLSEGGTNNIGRLDYAVQIEFLNDQPLPAQFVSLVAFTGDSKITLVWETGAEINNAGFEVFRKAENENEFVKIASYETNPALKGLGTSSYGRKYTYTDVDVRKGVLYEYKIYSVDFNGNRQEFGSVSARVVGELPERYALYQNYPNPFNPRTTIKFDLKESGNVRVEVYNVLGERVAVIYDGYMEAGYGRSWGGCVSGA